MNQTSPVVTGGVAVTGAMLGGVVVWLCQSFHITPPTPEVAGTIGAGLLSVAHALLNRLDGGAK